MCPSRGTNTFLLNYFLGCGEGAPLAWFLCKTQRSLHGRHVWEMLTESFRQRKGLFQASCKHVSEGFFKIFGSDQIRCRSVGKYASTNATGRRGGDGFLRGVWRIFTLVAKLLFFCGKTHDDGFLCTMFLGDGCVCGAWACLRRPSGHFQFTKPYWDTSLDQIRCCNPCFLLKFRHTQQHIRDLQALPNKSCTKHSACMVWRVNQGLSGWQIIEIQCLWRWRMSWQTNRAMQLQLGRHPSYDGETSWWAKSPFNKRPVLESRNGVIRNIVLVYMQDGVSPKRVEPTLCLPIRPCSTPVNHSSCSLLLLGVSEFLVSELQ